MLSSFTVHIESPSTLAYRPLVSFSLVSFPSPLTWALSLGSYLSLINRSMRFFRVPHPTLTLLSLCEVSSFVCLTCRILALTLNTWFSQVVLPGKTKPSHWDTFHRTSGTTASSNSPFPVSYQLYPSLSLSYISPWLVTPVTILTHKAQLPYSFLSLNSPQKWCQPHLKITFSAAGLLHCRASLLLMSGLCSVTSCKLF